MNKERKNLLTFGYGLAEILTFLSVKNGLKHGFGPFHFIFLGLAVILLILTLTYSPWLKEIYIRWMKVAHLIGNTVQFVVLTVIYYLVFTPVSIFLKLTGKDFLGLKIEKEKSSYWNIRPKKVFDPNTYTKQF